MLPLVCRPSGSAAPSAAPAGRTSTHPKSQASLPRAFAPPCGHLARSWCLSYLRVPRPAACASAEPICVSSRRCTPPAGPPRSRSLSRPLRRLSPPVEPHRPIRKPRAVAPETAPATSVPRKRLVGRVSSLYAHGSHYITCMYSYVFTCHNQMMPSGALSYIQPPATVELSSAKNPAILRCARAIAKSCTSRKGPQPHRKPRAPPTVTQRQRPFPAATRKAPVPFDSHP